MAEQTQVQQQGTMKGPKKFEAGKILAEWNRRKREEPAQSTKAQSEPKLTHYGTGAVVVIGALGFLVTEFTNSRKLLKRLWLTKLMKLWFTDPRTIGLNWSGP